MESNADWLLSQMPPEYKPGTSARVSNRERETAKEDALFEEAIRFAETQQMVKEAIARVALKNLSPEAPWRSRALCGGAPSLFDNPVGKSDINRAKAFCHACDVSEQCLQYALNLNELGDMVWGGCTPTELAALRRGGRSR